MKMAKLKLGIDLHNRASVFMPQQGLGYDLNQLIDLAVRAASCVGADYAGVDIIQARDGNFLVLEVNSMPAWNGLQAVTHINIADHLVGAFLDAALPPSRRKDQEGA
jgi:hypothetical protein